MPAKKEGVTFEAPINLTPPLVHDGSDIPMPTGAPGDVPPDDTMTARVNAVRERSKNRTAQPKRLTADKEIDKLREELQRNVGFVALFVMTRDAWTGQLVADNSNMVIDSWLEVARVNPGFRQALIRLLDTGVYVAAIANTGLLIIAIMAHNGLVPNSPFVLSALSNTQLQMPDEAQVNSLRAMFGQDIPSSNGNSGK